MKDNIFPLERPVYQKRPLEEDHARYRQLCGCWDEILRDVKEKGEFSEITYHLWIEKLELENVSDEYVFISTDKDDVRAIVYLEKRFKAYFELLISEIVQEEVTVRFLFVKKT